MPAAAVKAPSHENCTSDAHAIHTPRVMITNSPTFLTEPPAEVEELDARDQRHLQLLRELEKTHAVQLQRSLPERDRKGLQRGDGEYHPIHLGVPRFENPGVHRGTCEQGTHREVRRGEGKNRKLCPQKEQLVHEDDAHGDGVVEPDRPRGDHHLLREQHVLTSHRAIRSSRVRRAARVSPRVKIFKHRVASVFVEQGKIIHPSARRAVLSSSECRDYIALDKSYSIN